MDSAAEPRSKLNNVLGCTVGQRIFGFGPHKLIGIEFGGIGRKSMHMEPLVLANELLNDEAPVDGTAIPQQHNRSAQVAQKVTQETDDLHPGNIDAVEAEVKSKPMAPWGDGEGGDGRNPLPVVAVSEDRGLADRRPGLAHVRDEEESAFVEEGEMGPKSLGFFLTWAIPVSSSVRWPARFSAWPDAPASAMSILDPSSPARRGPGGSGFQNAARSVSQCAAESTDLSCIQLSGLPVSEVVAVRASAGVTTAVAFPMQAWAAEHAPHLPESSESSAPASLWRRSRSQPPMDMSCQHGATLWRSASVPPAVEEFLGVSCPIV